MRPAEAGPHLQKGGVHRQPLRANSSQSALSEVYRKRGRLSFVVAVPQAFDYRAFSAFLPQLPDIVLVKCVVDLSVAMSACKAATPDCVVIDVSYPNGAAYAAGHDLLKSKSTRTVAFFDGRFAFCRAYRALTIGAGTCYFTRSFDVNELCARVRVGGPSSRHSFISTLEDLNKYDNYGVRSLSSKEHLVFQWLACGHSVRGVAEKLGLAESTIDNHKSRIMRKLNIHRASELVGIALEIGAVDLH